MTATKLRYTADVLDLLVGLVAERDIVVVGGCITDPALTEAWDEWLLGSDMQDDLRAWADDIDDGTDDPEVDGMVSEVMGRLTLGARRDSSEGPPMT